MVLRSAVAVLFVSLAASAGAAQPPANPAIDMEGYLRVAREAAAHRATRRIPEADFIRWSREPGTVVLDARSAAKYAELHESLQRILPDRGARILIYCNNNFSDAPGAFPAKRADASLNLSTYIALYSYGYRNVYELAPLLSLGESALEFTASGRR
jgi:phage shock protein E